MSTVTLPDVPRRQFLLLEGLSWNDYREFERLTDDQPGLRLTYDRGRLELTTRSHVHEFVKTVIGYFVLILTEEFDVPRKSGGSTTFRREDLDKGLEPDQCYYLDNEPLVRGKDELDLTVDPPPDVVIEIEISRSVLDRLGIFAAMGVPEVWCSDGESLRFLSLTDAGAYEQRPESRYFAGIRSEGVERFLKQRKQVDERTLVHSFREWVQQVRGGSGSR